RLASPRSNPPLLLSRLILLRDRADRSYGVCEELDDGAGDHRSEGFFIPYELFVVQRAVDPENARAVHRRPRHENEARRVARRSEPLLLTLVDGALQHHEPLSKCFLLLLRKQRP